MFVLTYHPKKTLALSPQLEDCHKSPRRFAGFHREGDQQRQWFRDRGREAQAGRMGKHVDIIELPYSRQCAAC